MDDAWWYELFHLIVIIPFMCFFLKREVMEQYNAVDKVLNPIVLLKNILVHLLESIFSQDAIDLTSIILNLIYLGNLFVFNVQQPEFVDEHFRQW